LPRGGKGKKGKEEIRVSTDAGKRAGAYVAFVRLTAEWGSEPIISLCGERKMREEENNAGREFLVIDTSKKKTQPIRLLRKEGGKKKKGGMHLNSVSREIGGEEVDIVSTRSYVSGGRHRSESDYLLQRGGKKEGEKNGNDRILASDEEGRTSTATGIANGQFFA